ncbi:hypothetical protein AwEntero_17900 [Enterobacterales bacterium]|nr:hypothetical protein AwEntero_17900 [Enterobacterales bacterium]
MAKTNVVDAALFQRRQIILSNIQFEAPAFKIVQHMLRIFAACVNVGKPVTTMPDTSPVRDLDPAPKILCHSETESRHVKHSSKGGSLD